MSIHKAIIAPIRITPHPDPTVHSLAVGTVCHETVICGKDIPDGTLGVYFPCELQLSEEFAVANDFLRRKDPVTGKPAGGMFDANRRVRVQKFKGIKSVGFWTSLEALQKLGGSTASLKEGDQIDTWNGKPVCNKYITPQTQRHLSNKSTKQRKDNPLFIKHSDTSQFKYCLSQIKPGDNLVITNKLHGCVHKDTIVDTLYGKKTIKEIVDAKSPTYIKGRDLDIKEDIYTKVEKFFFVEDDGEWYEIELEDGRKIVITGNNPIYLPNLNIYRRVDELKINDVCLVDE